MAEATSSGGIGFCGLLTIVFITLKLTDVIAWSWLWVLSPLWLPVAFILGLLAVGALGFVGFLAIAAAIKALKK